MSPAYALVADGDEFVFIESVSGSTGTFTIINNSTDWYIWGFAVTNIEGSKPATTFSDWNAATCDNNCADPGYNGSGFSYQSTSGALPIGNDIGPGQRSSLFTFTLPEGSTPLLFLRNAGGATLYITPTGAIPEPSTWAMLIAGFGFLGWRYGLRRGRLRKLIGAT